jgi:sulfite exporter TauE/SafE
MADTIIILALTAAFLGFFHTVIGPDHYLPFIVLSKARKWSLSKTTAITIICGVGHVLSSVLIGLAGIALGIAVSHIEGIEASRGAIAAWALIAFGLVYMVWGLHRAWKKKTHTHLHFHGDGAAHKHKHKHSTEHMHVHERKDAKGRTTWKTLTPWVLFTIFVFGPCEPLIPLVMYPAAVGSMWGVAAVVIVFSVVTIATMTVIVLAVSTGISRVKTTRIERYSHALAGATIFFSGLAIMVLGL